MIRKRIKIYDCFFYFDEIELLNLRLGFLNNKIDKFVIIEFEQDFNFNKKNEMLDLSHLNPEIQKEKLIHIKIPFLTEEDVRDFYIARKIKKYIVGFEKNGREKKDLIRIGFLLLLDFLLKEDFLIEDLILISDVDEFPDLSNMEELIEKVNFGPLVFKNKNFIWSEKFCLRTKHEGSILFNFSSILTNNKNFEENYFAKNNFRGRKNVIHLGWHLSHFCDLERSLQKFKLLYPDINLSKTDIINSMKNLENPVTNSFGVNEKLIENDEMLPFSTSSLSKTFLGRNKRKKILVNLFGDKSVNFENFDEILEINFEPRFLPKFELYETNSGQDFRKIYLINEVVGKINKMSPLNQDIICVVLEKGVTSSELNFEPNYFDPNRRFVIIDWMTLKNNILSDLIYQEIT